MREKTERTADEKWPVKHSVEPGRVRIGRIMVAAPVKDRQFVAEPILIDRKLELRHLRADFNALAGDTI